MRIPKTRRQKFHYSPLRYPGGKSFLFPLLDHFIQRARLTNPVYIEPFAGGAGAALALLFLEKVDRIVINDLDRAIYAFWRSILIDTERFVDAVLSTPISVKEWLKQRSVYRNSRSHRFELGFATFYLNRTNISGIIDGGPIGGVDQKGKWKIDARFYRETLADRIVQVGEYRNRITVKNLDGLALIDEYLDEPSAFIYLDPPYFEKGSSLYLNHYDCSDHMILAEWLNYQCDANWVLTYDDDPVIRSLYQDRQGFRFSPNHNAYRLKKGSELLIVSDALIEA